MLETSSSSKAIDYLIAIALIIGTLFALAPLRPGPQGVIQSGDLLDSSVRVSAYLIVLVLVWILWRRHAESTIGAFIMLATFTIFFTSLWYFVLPNGGLLGGYGFPDRALYVVRNGMLPSASLDNYVTSLPGIFVLWSTAMEVTHFNIGLTLTTLNSVVGLEYSFLVYAIATRILKSRDLGMLSALIATVGNPFLFRGIELDSLYGLVYFFLMVFLFVRWNKGPRQIAIVIMTLASIITYPLPAILFLIFLAFSLLALRYKGGVLPGFNITTRSAINQLATTMILFLGWFLYLGISYDSYLALILRAFSSSVGPAVPNSYLNILLQGEITLLPGWAVFLTLFWYVAIYAIGSIGAIYLVLKKDRVGLITMLLLGPCFLLAAIMLPLTGALVIRTLIYFPAFSAMVIVALLSKTPSRPHYVSLLILLIALPTLISYYPTVSYQIQYPPQISAGGFLENYHNSNGAIIYGTGASPLEIQLVWQTEQVRFFQVSGSAFVQAVLNLFEMSPGAVFPYSNLFAIQISQLSNGNVTSGEVNLAFQHFLSTRDVVYNNGLSTIAWNQ